MKLLALSSFLAVASASPTQEQKKLKLRGSAANLEFPKPRALQDVMGTENFCQTNYADTTTSFPLGVDLSNIAPDKETGNCPGNSPVCIDGYLSRSDDHFYDDTPGWDQINPLLGLNEYDPGLALEMFTGGKNTVEGAGKFSTGTNYMVYDFNLNRLCVAAVLDHHYLEPAGEDRIPLAENGEQIQDYPVAGIEKVEPCGIDPSEDEAYFLSGTREGGKPKHVFRLSDAVAHEIIYHPTRTVDYEGSMYTVGQRVPIGFEACWDICNVENWNIFERPFETHYNRCPQDNGDGQTTAPGRDTKNGQFICLDGPVNLECPAAGSTGSTEPSVTSSTTTAATSTTIAGGSGSTTTQVPGGDLCQAVKTDAEVNTVLMESSPRIQNATCGDYDNGDWKGLADLTEDYTYANAEIAITHQDHCSQTVGITWKNDDCADTAYEIEGGSYKFDRKVPLLQMPTEQQNVTCECGKLCDMVKNSTSAAYQGTPSFIGEDYCDGTKFVGMTDLDPSTYSSTRAPATWECAAGSKVKGVAYTDWTVEDHCDVYSLTSSVTTVDHTKPEIQDNGLVLNMNVLATDYDFSQSLPLISEFGQDVATTDVCDLEYHQITALTFCDEISDTSNGVSITRTFTATDQCGNEETLSQTVEVQDSCAIDGTQFEAFSGPDFQVGLGITTEKGIEETSSHNYIRILINTTENENEEKDGDLRGLFIDITGGGKFHVDGGGCTAGSADCYDITETIIEVVEDGLFARDGSVIELPHYYEHKCTKENLIRLNNDVTARGGGKNGDGGRTYYCAVEIGEQGIRGGDDVAAAEIRVHHPRTPLDVNDLTGHVAVRLTSVSGVDADGTNPTEGTSGKRDRSAKVNMVLSNECRSNTKASIANYHPCAAPSGTTSTAASETTSTAASDSSGTTSSISTTTPVDCEGVKSDYPTCFPEIFP